ncbi:DsbA family oxidoreductase [Streptomyces synnematoformans]|uniref:DsbA family oxidoreductase n=1 Tax=Streptomyces synnematoformans TaxID=415721 RepID=UPI003CD052BA
MPRTASSRAPSTPTTRTRWQASRSRSGWTGREILTSNEYADRVRADRRAGVELGATGVPFVVLDRRVAAPGAQKVAVYARLLEQAAGPVPSERVS